MTIRIWMVAGALCALLAACGRTQSPESIVLPPLEGASYEVVLQKRRDENPPTTPFRLSWRNRDDKSGDEYQILSAEYCGDVALVQTPDLLYLFYDRLTLARFSTEGVNPRAPRTMLCDARTPNCKRILADLVASGNRRYEVCN